jgi:hypothetical protein
MNIYGGFLDWLVVQINPIIRTGGGEFLLLAALFLRILKASCWRFEA